MTNKSDFDILFFCFSNPKFDGRSVNIANILSKNNKSILYVSPYPQETSFKENQNIDYQWVNIDIDTSVRKRMKLYKNSLKKKIKANSCKFILACDFYSLPISYYYSKKFKAKLIYDSREIYSKLGSLAKRPFTQKVIEILEKFYINFVNQIIVSGDRDAEYLKKHFKHNTKYVTIKNLPPKREITRTNFLRKKFNISEDSIIFLYQGWILDGRGLIPFIESIKNIDNLVFFIIGEGDFKNKVSLKTRDLELNHKVYILEGVEYDKLHEYTASADVGISLFEPISKSYEYALPNKLFEYIQSSIPILATNLPSIAEVIKDKEQGVLVNDPSNLEEIKNAIKYLMNLENLEKIRIELEKIKKKYIFESQEIEILKVFI